MLKHLSIKSLKIIIHLYSFNQYNLIFLSIQLDGRVRELKAGAMKIVSHTLKKLR